MIRGNRSNPFSFLETEFPKLREPFMDSGFDEKSILAAFGVDSMRALRDLSMEVVLRRMEGDSPLTVLLRIFIAGLPCDAKLARRTLKPLDLERWIAGGMLFSRDDRVVATVGIVATEGLLIAYDRIWSAQGEESPDHVMGPSDSARYLSRLAVPQPCEASLDLGTGCGLLALIEASQSRRVSACDLNPRAVAFARFNTQLNGCSNVEVLQGDLFTPVKERTFDRIVSNPPFVISPETQLIYLTGGSRGDILCRKIAREGSQLLSEGGTLQMLCNWVEPASGEWADGLRGWFEDSGCDVWVLRQSTKDAESYARGWMQVGKMGANAQDPGRLQTWLRFFEQEQISSIGQGFVMMRKRAGANWFRAFDGPPNLLGSAGEAVVERMRTFDFLAGAESDSTLMESVFAVAPSVRLTQECEAASEGWIQVSAHLSVTDGLGYVEVVDAFVAELVASCNARRSLRDAIDFTIQKLGWKNSDIPEETAEIIRQLLEEGFLIPV